MRIEKVLTTLNKKQLEAVQMPRVPILMLAGPGTGKTRTLIARIVYQIHEFEIAPEYILALTFSNKAAQEIKHRLQRDLSKKAEKIHTGTIHSFCLNILRKYYSEAELDKHFTVCNDEYQNALLNNLVADKVRSNKDKVVTGIRMAIDHFILLNKPMPPFTAMIYDLYTAHLKKHKLIDYNQILSKTLELLKSNPDICEQYRFLYQAIHVDEFQDTDIIQYEIIKLLAEKHRNIFVVADDDQSIYAWRGANPENIKTYMEDFNIEKPIFLDINYRSGPVITKTAYSIVKDIERIEPEKLLQPGGSAIDSVNTQFFDNEEQEITYIFEKIKYWNFEKKIPFSEIAVLYPQHRFSEKLALKFVAERIPFQQASGRNFSDDPQMKKILLYLQVIRDPLDTLFLADLVESELGYHAHKQIQNLQITSQGSYRKAMQELVSRKEISEDLRRQLSTFIGNLANLVNLRSFFTFEQLIKQIINGLQDFDKSYLEEKTLKFSDFDTEQFTPFTRNSKNLYVYHAQNKMAFIAQKMLSTVFKEKVHIYKHENIKDIHKKDFLLLLSDIKEKPNSEIIDLSNKSNSKRQSVLSTLLRWMQNYITEEVPIFDNYVVFDLETTGRDPEKCEIVEIAAVRIRDRVIQDSFQTLVNPGIKIDPEATQVHNISDEDVKNAPAVEEVWKDFTTFIGDDILLAHNGYSFDFRIIDRYSKKFSRSKQSNIRYDSLIMARQMYPGSRNSIDALAEKFNLDPGNRHRALDDVKVLHKIFQKMLAEHDQVQKKMAGGFLFEYAALACFLENTLTKYEDKVIFLAGVQKLLSPYSSIINDFCEEFSIDREELYERLSEKARQLFPGMVLYNNRDDFKQRLFEIVKEFNRFPIEKAIAEFLSLIMLVNPQDRLAQVDAVSLLTFHAAKGLEFKKVIIMGMEDDSMPSFFAYKEDDYDDRTTEKKMDEQKRLLYVGLTRAKEEVIFTAVKHRFGKSQKSSPFLREILNYMKKNA